MKRSMLLVLVVLGLSLATFAQTPVQKAVSDFGLVGSWGVDCQNTKDYSTFTYRDGLVHEELGLAANKQTRTYVYKAAERIDATHLSVSVTVSDNTTVNGKSMTLIYLKRGDGRMQTVSNIRADGTVVVKDGKIVGSGEATPSWGRCQ